MTDLSESVRRLRDAERYVAAERGFVTVLIADRDAVLDALERRTEALRRLITEPPDCPACDEGLSGQDCICFYTIAEIAAAQIAARAALAGDPDGPVGEPQP